MDHDSTHESHSYDSGREYIDQPFYTFQHSPFTFSTSVGLNFSHFLNSKTSPTMACTKVELSFERYSDSRYNRRRSRKKSIDIEAMQKALLDLGHKVSATEMFEVMKQYTAAPGMIGQIDYDAFCVVLRNIRAQYKANPVLMTAFKSLGGTESGTIEVSHITKAVDKLKSFSVDCSKLEFVCGRKEPTDTIDFNEFACLF